jgi:hypothetical protein
LTFQRFDQLKPEYVGETVDESTGEVLPTYIGPLYDPPYFRTLKEPSEVTAHAAGYTDWGAAKTAAPFSFGSSFANPESPSCSESEAILALLRETPWKVENTEDGVK